MTSRKWLILLLKIGKFVSVVNESDNSDDEEEEQESLFSNIPPIPPRKSYMDLSINEQFLYLLPILDVVMRGEYPPSNGRHRIFMKDGRGRSALSKSAGAKGDLSSREVDRLLKCLIRYAITNRGVALERVEQRSMEVDITPGEAMHGPDAVRPVESEDLSSSCLSPPPTTIGHDDYDSAGTRSPVSCPPHMIFRHYPHFFSYSHSLYYFYFRSMNDHYHAQLPAVISPSSLPPPPSSVSCSSALHPHFDSTARLIAVIQESSFVENELTSVPSDRDTLIAAEVLGALRTSRDAEPLTQPDIEEVRREGNGQAENFAEHLPGFNELSEPEKIDVSYLAQSEIQLMSFPFFITENFAN